MVRDHLASDRFIAYSTWKWFDLHRKNSSQPVYRYLYSKLRPPLVDQNKASGWQEVHNKVVSKCQSQWARRMLVKLNTAWAI